MTDDGLMEQMDRGPGAFTPDGCPVELYACLSPRHREAGLVAALLPDQGSVLDLGSGPGLIAEPLAGRGHHVVAVDQSPEMLARLRAALPVLGDVEGLALDERFDVVLLASHLVNTADGWQRDEFLATAARHVAPAGHVVIEWHTPEWFDGLVAGTSVHGTLDGLLVELQVHDLTHGVLAATVVYRSEEATWAQAFRAVRLEWDELEHSLHRHGLVRPQRLTEDGHWVSARPGPT